MTRKDDTMIHAYAMGAATKGVAEEDVVGYVEEELGWTLTGREQRVAIRTFLERRNEILDAQLTKLEA